MRHLLVRLPLLLGILYTVFLRQAFEWQCLFAFALPSFLSSFSPPSLPFLCSPSTFTSFFSAAFMPSFFILLAFAFLSLVKLARRRVFFAFLLAAPCALSALL
jgi:hypothetical protein